MSLVHRPTRPWRLLLASLVLTAAFLPLRTDRAEAVAPKIDVAGPCGLVLTLDVAGIDLCTHGPDVMPAPRAAAADGAGRPVPERSVACLGDGSGGQRVEVLYVHGSNRGAASSGLRANVERWVEQVEWTVATSALRHGGERRVRWRTDSCRVRIASERVSNAALGDFATMVEELRARGHDRNDRTYLTFVDASTVCGIATAPRDDRATSNRADRTAGYARVDRPCWDAGDRGFHSIAAHELFHTLGAVQASAPNATPGAHCTDEHDLLCYDDGTGGGMRTVCRDGDSSTSGAGDAFDRLLDCRGNDYFNPSPPRGSYLDTHWNTADSARLHDPDAPRGGSGGSGGSGGGSGGSGGGQDDPPTPTGDPVAFVLDLLTG